MPGNKLLERRNIKLGPIQGASLNTNDVETTSRGKQNGFLGSPELKLDSPALKSEGTRIRKTENNNQSNNIIERASDDTAESPPNPKVAPSNGVRKNHKTDTKEEDKGKKPTLLESIFSWRAFIAVLLHLSFFLSASPKTSMPLALVCMVNQMPTKPSASEMTNRTGNQNSSIFRNVFETNGTLKMDNATESMREMKEFDWDPQIEGLLLSSPNFSSFLGPLLAGLLKGHLGSKLTLTLFMTIANLMNFLVPICARVNPYVLVANRAVLGLTTFASMPIVGEYVAHWYADSETLTVASFAYAGMNVGSLVTSLVSGFICYIPLDNGWPFIFYFLGIFGVLWQLAWHFLSAANPETHRFISEREKNYIKAHRQGEGQGDKTKPPYRKILTSIPVYAFITVASCHVWNLTVFFSYGPIYMIDVLKFSVQETGVIFAVLVAGRCAGVVAWASIGNCLISRGMSKNASRKLVVFTGMFSAGVITVIMSFFGGDHRWVVLGLLVIMMVLQSVGTSTASVVPVDMAPKYVGFLTGLGMTLAMLISMSEPLIASSLTPTGSYEEWRIVWILVAAVYTTGSIIFAVFGHADVLPWAESDTNKQPQTVNSSVEMGGKSEFAIQNLGFEKEEEGPSRSEQNKESELRNTDASEFYEVDLGDATCSSHIDNYEVLTTGYTADKANWSESTRL